MNGPETRQIRQQEELYPERIWQMYLNTHSSQKSPVVFLTKQQGELVSSPLPEGHFFGREEELFDLREMLKKRGKYLLSGIGGVGKTELLRQLLRYCCEKQLVDDVCMIQYELSLENSFVNAFPNLWCGTSKTSFNRILKELNSKRNRHVLILIDNMNQKDDESLSVIAKLPATIIITSRLQELSGFETYHVSPPSNSSGKLIFRDNYNNILTQEDRCALDEIIKEQEWCHTLTLRLLGKIASSKKWSVSLLKQHLTKNENILTWNDDDRMIRLNQVYRQLYSLSGLKKSRKKILQLFSLFPYGSYSLEFAERFISVFLDPDEKMHDELEELWAYGWLEKGLAGYAMHPVVAECIGGSLKEENFEPFFDQILDILDNHVLTATSNFESARELLNTFLAAAVNLSGPISQKLIYRILKHITLNPNEEFRLIDALSVENLKQIKILMERCKNIDDESRVRYLILTSNYLQIDDVLLEDEIKRQDVRRTISHELYLTLCSFTGKSLAIHGQTEQAIFYLQRVLSENQILTMEQKLTAMYHLSLAYSHAGDFSKELEILNEATAQARTNGYENHIITQALLIAQVRLEGLIFRQYEKAKLLLNQIEKSLDKFMIGNYLVTFYTCKGAIEGALNHHDTAIDCLKKAKEYSELIWNKTVNYADACAELAVALNRAGHREEALENYLECLEILDREHRDSFTIHIINNNVGVMFLDWNKPDEALPYLHTAYSLGVELGTIAHGESAKNMARLSRMLGKEPEELHYLEEACPLLSAAYGESHQRVLDIRKRLDELKN